MAKKKVGNVTWSLMFKVSGFRASSPSEIDYVWRVLHEFDKADSVAFSEFAYEEENIGWGYSWYSWHNFLSKDKALKVIPLIFKAFPEVDYVEIYKDRQSGSFCNTEYRGLVRE